MAKPCRSCGADVRVEEFGEQPNSPIRGTVRVWLCSANKLLGGSCPDETAYLSEADWDNQAIAPSAANAPSLRE